MRYTRLEKKNVVEQVRELVNQEIQARTRKITETEEYKNFDEELYKTDKLFKSLKDGNDLIIARKQEWQDMYEADLMKMEATKKEWEEIHGATCSNYLLGIRRGDAPCLNMPNPYERMLRQHYDSKLDEIYPLPRINYYFLERDIRTELTSIEELEIETGKEIPIADRIEMCFEVGKNMITYNGAD